MAKYIDKSALMAEIERRIFEDYNSGDEEMEEVDEAVQGALVRLRYFIDTLEVKEVNMPALDNGKMPVERWREAVQAASNQANYRKSQGLTETCDDYFVDGVQWADEHPIVTKEVNLASIDPIAFGTFWDAYDKKVERKKTEALWNRLSKHDREAALAYLPAYKAAQPDKRFRKNPATFLRNRSWEDEIIDQTTHTTHATLPHSTAVMAETNKAEVRELSRLATAGAAALAGLVGGGEDE